MAGGVPGAEPSPSAWPRGWLSYREYKVVHARYMDVLLRDAIVVSDDLVFEEVFDESSGDIVQIGLRGNVNLACGARLKVTKWMETRGRRDGDGDVRTIYY